MADRFCCLACRLVQVPTTTCVECGSPLIASLANERDLLRYRDVNDGLVPARGGAWKSVATGVGFLGAYLGIVAGAMLWWPLVPITLGSAGSLAILRRTGPVAGVPVLAAKVAADAVVRTGVARKLAETVTGIAGEPVFVEEATVIGRGGVLMRQIRNVAFLVELAGGERLVVTGIVRLTGRARDLGKLEKRDARLASFGVPAAIPLAGRLEIATLRDGDPVSVTGALAVEAVAELAFHRDAGATDVMRGRAEAVVAIASPGSAGARSTPGGSAESIAQ